MEFQDSPSYPTPSPATSDDEHEARKHGITIQLLKEYRKLKYTQPPPDENADSDGWITDSDSQPHPKASTIDKTCHGFEQPDTSDDEMLISETTSMGTQYPLSFFPDRPPARFSRSRRPVLGHTALRTRQPNHATHHPLQYMQTMTSIAVHGYEYYPLAITPFPAGPVYWRGNHFSPTSSPGPWPRNLFGRRMQEKGANMPKGSLSITKVNSLPLSTISSKIDDENVTKSSSSLETTENEGARERDQWSRPVEFVLSCIASSVGLGNVWRFPFTVYENGGGAFLIPYIIILILIGRPMYFMELSLGQFSSFGNVKVWKCVPLLKGIGIGQAFTNFYVMTYYAVLAATCIFYLGACFQDVLPWTYCDPEWADDNCFDSSSNCTLGERLPNGTCNSNNTSITRQSSAVQYNSNFVYKLSSGMHDFGTVDLRLAACLLLCWIFLFFSIFRGVKSLGKTAYFTALFPYVVLIALLVVGSTLDGAVDGIIYFVRPQWDKLLDAVVWYKACEQMLFSLTVGYGVLIVYSSYNGFHHTIYRDAMIISVLDTCTSMLAGLTIFSVIGALAKELKVDIKDVVKTDSSLAFVAYPEAVSRIKIVPQLWAVMFFLMMLTLAVGTLVGGVSSVMTILHDEMPHIKKWKILLVVCIAAYGIGLVYITSAGQYALKLVDSLGAGFSTFVFAIGECVGVMWVYGMKRFTADISLMLGFELGWYWKITWGVISPIILTLIFIYYVVTLKPLSLGTYIYPSWAQGIGWALGAIALSQLVIWAIVTIVKQEGASFSEKFLKSLRPAPDWGPRQPKDRAAWEAMKSLSSLKLTADEPLGETELKTFP